MNTEQPQKQQPRDYLKLVPYELNNPIPWPVVAIAIAIAVWGVFVLYTDEIAATRGEKALVKQQQEQPASKPNSVTTATEQAGATIFATHCATCHQNNGAGISNAVPPLDGSPYVLASPEVPVNIVIHGIAGPIEVGGERFNGRMPTFGHTLDDEEIAAVVNHIRNSWSNTAGKIDAAFVSGQRQRFAERQQPWTGGAELNAVFRLHSAESTDANNEKPGEAHVRTGTD